MRVREYTLTVSETADNLRWHSGQGLVEVTGEPFPEKDLRVVEIAWLQEHHDELARQYPGEWIAIDGPELVAHATDLSTLLDRARQAGHPDPFVTAIPSEPDLDVYACLSLSRIL